MKHVKKAAAASLAATAVLGLTSCSTQVNDADVVSQNISTAADNFEVARKISVINNKSNTNTLEIVGLCNIVTEPQQLEITCKTPGEGIDRAKKHFAGLNENTTYTVEQIDSIGVSADSYRVVYNPSTLIPDIELR